MPRNKVSRRRFLQSRCVHQKKTLCATSHKAAITYYTQVTVPKIAEGCFRSWQTDEYGQEPDYHEWLAVRYDKLDIHPGYPKPHFDSNGMLIFIQLRKVQSSGLLIGCGNNPTSISYNYPLDVSESARQISDDCYRDSTCGGLLWQQRFDEHDHCHEGWITVDPNVAMNPTFIGAFGYFKLPLEDDSLTSIVQEGILLNKSPLYESEIVRLLGDNVNMWTDEITIEITREGY